VLNAELTVVSEEEVAGTEIPGGEGRGRQYLSLHCDRQNDSCIKMGSDESHCNVSLAVRDKVTRQVFADHTAFDNLAFSVCVDVLAGVAVSACLCVRVYIYIYVCVCVSVSILYSVCVRAL